MAGREPATGRTRRGRAVWLLAIAQTAALIVLIAVAVHYRAEAGRASRVSPRASGHSTSALPDMTSVMLRLPAARPLTGTDLITAAAQPGDDRAQFMVSAVITGGQPDTVYDLVGNDCSAVAPLPDHVWATGFTDAAGAAQLTGYAWTGAVADVYWLALSPSQVYAAPGLHGRFAEGSAAPFPVGHAPYAPS